LVTSASPGSTLIGRSWWWLRIEAVSIVRSYGDA
jgi:hypothetical protein